MRTILLLFFYLSVCTVAFSQGIIRGKILNPVNNQPVAYANILVLGTEMGAISDENGSYEITGVPTGLYNVRASFVGYREKTAYEVQVTLARPVQLDFELREDASELSEVVVSSEFTRSEELPLSVRKLNSNEIERYPGGNRDISKVIQALPGVASTPSFRNDILIRGGAPNENKFFVDEIEVPVINHFATQGSSGGPVGILNVNLIKNVDLIAGGFPANRMNALSSFFEIQLKEGRRDKMATQLTVGASELTLSNEGPIGEKTTYLLSARRSYLQGLFKLLGLPFLPTFNDFQLKTTTKLNEKTELTFIGVGAIDKFMLNKDVPDGETAEELESRLYLLDVLPVQNQWNYATGLKLKRYRENGFWTFILSRNMLDNRSVKYAANDESSAENLLFDYSSQESENKFRAENSIFGNGYSIEYGVNYEYARYFIQNFDRATLAAAGETIIEKSTSFFNSYGAFVSGTKYYFSERLLLSGGMRMDGSDFGKTAKNPLHQLSPRVSVSYQLKPNLYITANAGIYYQKPPYTVLGYKENGELINQENDVKFIRNSQLIAGLELLFPSKNRRFTAEVFYKQYSNYPSSTRNGISLANLGADFGVIGNEPVTSSSKGRAYGLEFLAQQRLYNDFYGIAALTLVRSEFTNPNTDGYTPSSWDNRIIISLTAGKRFGKNWELGARWRYVGGTPYTPPYDYDGSSLISNWDLRNQAILDYNQINAIRLTGFHQLDLRLDKKYYFKKWTLNWYVDIQNAYNFQAAQPPLLVPVRTQDGTIEVDPNDPGRYLLKYIENTAGSVLPTVGIIVEF